MKIKVSILLIGLMLSLSSFGQQGFELTLNISDNPKHKLSYKKTHSTRIAVLKELEKIRMQLYDQAYMFHTVDTAWNANVLKATITQNEVLQWKQLRLDSTQNIESIPQDILHLNTFNKQSFQINKLFNFYEGIVSYYEENGYPFASIKFTDFSISQEKHLSAAIYIDSGPKITIDSLIIHGNAKVSHRYLRYYLGIHKGDLFKQSQIDKINQRLRDLSFLDQSKAFEIQIINNFARIHLHLKDRPVNLFNGLIAFGSEKGNSNKLVFTGNFQIKLINAFEHGSELQAKWNKPPGNSQVLYLYGDYPYALNTPFGVQYTLNIDRRDSSFLNVHHKPGLRLYFSAKKSIGLYYAYYQSQLLAPTNFNPDQLDYTKTHMGMNILWQDLNHPLFPTQGYRLQGGVEAGQKQIQKNTAFAEHVYDSISIESFAASMNISVEGYYPFYERHVLYGKMNSQGVFGKRVQDNEFYQLGGFGMLRGFDEYAFNSPLFMVISAEYHFHLDQRSYLFLFYDQGFLSEGVNSSDTFFNQRPLGFGTGMNFGTKAGIFSVSFALGREHHSQVQIRNTKVHFGYFVRF